MSATETASPLLPVPSAEARVTASPAASADAAPLWREGNENLIKLTESAGAKVTALFAREKQGEFLRIAITGGGCNGLSYKLRFAP